MFLVVVAAAIVVPIAIGHRYTVKHSIAHVVYVGTHRS